MLDGLNARFALPDQLLFEQHPSGLVQGRLETPLCRGSFFLHGAHVAEYQPAGQRPVLFMSEQSLFAADKPIRGGVPICFPWFGPSTTDSTAPAHGLVRTRSWEIVDTSSVTDGAVRVVLALKVEQWQLTYAVTFGAELDLNLQIVNQAETTRDCEAALHTYLQLADVDLASVHGLEQQAYFDKVSGEAVEPSGSPIRFTAETDRVYHGPVKEISVHDPGNGRTIRLMPRHSHSTVVWNPWVDKSRRLPDFGDQEFRQMCCVETANVGQHKLRLAPATEESMGVSLGLLG